MITTEPDIRLEHENGPTWQRQRQLAEWLAAPADASLRGSETVLVVESEPLVRGMIADILRGFGYRVLEASGASQAQYLMGAHERIDLLLTDFSMPENNGLILARWLQGKCPDLRVLITTGTLWELANQIGDQERVAILPKPFDGLQLGRMVWSILR